MPRYTRQDPSHGHTQRRTSVGGEVGLGEGLAPAGRPSSPTPAALRAPLRCELTWLGGRAEPVVMVRYDGQVWFMHSQTAVWEMVLRLKGWQPVH